MKYIANVLILMSISYVILITFLVKNIYVFCFALTDGENGPLFNLDNIYTWGWLVMK